MSEQAEATEKSTGSSKPVEVRILAEGFAAALYVAQDVTDFPTPVQVQKAIERAGVVYGIDDQAIDQLIDEQIAGKPVLFAEGEMPAGGGDAKLIWHEESDGEAIPRDISDAVLHGQQLPNLFTRVVPGQQILTKLPSSGGESGTNVFGEKLKLSGVDLAIPCGQGTEVSKDGLNLLATAQGIATWNGATIGVQKASRVKGNLESQNDNIRFEDSVYIENDVRPGCRVEARGDIFVGGSIEGADAYSLTGNVIVRNGILGQGRARILASGNVVAGFIQDATIGAKQDVEAIRYIINCAVTAGRYITVSTNEGIIRGGTLYAEKRIEARQVGSDGRIVTELGVGYTQPENVGWSRYEKRNEQRRLRMELAYLQKRVDFLQLLKARKGSLADENEAELVELEQKVALLARTNHTQSANSQRRNSQTSVANGDQAVAETLQFHGTVFPGVKISIGDATHRVARKRKNVIFFRVGNRLSFGPLDQAEASKT